MCREGSPLARLLQLAPLLLMVRGQELGVEQPMRAPELQSSRELLPVLKLLRWRVQPADRAAAPPARGEAAHSDAAVVQLLAVVPATAAVVFGQWIEQEQAVDRGTVERHP